MNKSDTRSPAEQGLSKVPEVTLVFWIIKIAATTLGETGGDALSMSLNLGYLISTAIFAVILLIAVSAQISTTRPVLQLLRALCEDGSGTQPRFDLTQPSDEPPVRARAFIVQAWVADRAAMA